jgi:MAE_28990/MAE_18760-like HEPN
MLAVQQDFTEREQEVSRYFAFLRCFADKEIAFNVQGASRFSPATERDELFKTLKANGFLLLYNLVESTLKNSIEAIFDELKLRSVSFDHCRLEVRKLVLKNLKKRDVDKVIKDVSLISVDVAFATFRKDELVSGNVDARLVRELADDYGFAAPKGRSDGLLTVKTNRNDLAHGWKSFSEVGRDFDLERLEEIMKEVVDFLRALLASVADYITTQSYLTAKTA